MSARIVAGAALGAAALLFASAATAEPVTVSFLTHWPPDTVAKVEAAAAEYKKSNPDVTVEVRAVPFGDLLTTLRTQGGSATGATIAGIYDLWLPELVRDGLVAPIPDDKASGVKSAWPEGVVSAASGRRRTRAAAPPGRRWERPSSRPWGVRARRRGGCE